MHQGLRSCLFAGIAAVAAVAASSGAGAETFKLTASSSHPPILPWVSTIRDLVVPEANKRLEAKGSPNRIEWTEAYAGTLYNFQNTLEGLEQGLGDIGWVGSLWEPVKMPLHNVAYYAPFVTYDIWQLLGMQRELEAGNKDFADEWTKHNLVFLGSQVADSYQLMTQKPVKSVDDIKGMKLIGAGAVSAMGAGTGAILVDAGLPVFYNNLQTGVAEGCIILVTGMIPFKLHEVAPYIAKVDMGAVISGGLAMNAQTWKRLPKDVQEVFRDLGREYGDEQTRRVAANEKKAWEQLPKLGAKVYEFPEAERKKWAMALDDVAGKWASDLEARGIPGKKFLAVFMETARKAGSKPLRDWK